MGRRTRYGKAPLDRSTPQVSVQGRRPNLFKTNNAIPVGPESRLALAHLRRGHISDEATRFWYSCRRNKNSDLQSAIILCEVQFGDGAYRTAEMRMVIFKLEGKQVKKENLVALTGIEPVFQP